MTEQHMRIYTSKHQKRWNKTTTLFDASGIASETSHYPIPDHILPKSSQSESLVKLKKDDERKHAQSIQKERIKHLFVPC